MTTGERIKNAREKAGLTLEEVGQRVGRPYQSIQAYERGKRNPKIDKLQQIADALGCPLGDLIEYPTGPPPEGIKKEPAPESGLNEDEVYLVGQFRELNDEGKEKVLEYVSDLTDTGKYQKTLCDSAG